MPQSDLNTDFLDLVVSKHSFLLTGHEHPDGDCLGAEVALYHLLRSLHKQVCIINPDPLTRTHEFLLAHTPIDAFQADVRLPDVDVVVLLDCAHLSRLAALGERLRGTSATVAVIDHHIGSEQGDAQVFLVDSSAPSTGALVHQLYQEMSVPLQPEGAEGVFLSLVSDTGWFHYSNTTSRVLAIAADLVAQGVEPARLYDQLYRHNHPDSVDLLAQALATHRRSQDGKYVYALLDKVAMDRAARAGFDTDLVLEPLRSVDGVEVVALFKERFDGAVRLSLRASGDTDVQAVASSFGGGGHRKAAGALLHLPLDQAVAAVEERVRAALAGASRV